MPGSRSSQRPCVSAMSSAPGANTSKTKRPAGSEQPARPRAAPRAGRRRSPCAAATGTGSGRVGTRPRRAGRACRPCRRSSSTPASSARSRATVEHPLREVDADHVDPRGGDRHRDPARPDAELEHRAARTHRLVDVERHVLDDAARPRVVEARDLVVHRHVAKLCSDAGDARDAVYAAPVPGPRRALAPSGLNRGFLRSPAEPKEVRTLDSVAAVDWTAYETEALAAYEAATSGEELADVNVRYLGRKAPLPQALRGVRDRETGLALNTLRAALDAAHEQAASRIARTGLSDAEWRRRDHPRRSDQPRPPPPADADPPRDRGHLPRHGLRGLGR